jgi:DNA-binding CsgD family transcriptional regulator
MRTAALHRDVGELLHAVLGCDAVALLAADRRASSVWVMRWIGGARGVEERLPVPAGLTARVAERQQLAWGTAASWPGGLELSPGSADRPPLRFQLVVPLVVGPDRLTACLLGRRVRDFSPEEIDHATLLAPGLRLRLDSSDVAPEAADRLTAREKDVLELVARGLTSRAIAHRLEISERTVHKHLERIYRKTGCRDRLSAVLRVRGLGLVPPGSRSEHGAPWARGVREAARPA